jgi:hypothetical protein
MGATTLQTLAAAALSHNKQFAGTVTPNRWRGARASFHCALALRFTRRCAAAELWR